MLRKPVLWDGLGIRTFPHHPTYLSNTHSKLHVHHKHHLEHDVIVSHLLRVQAHRNRDWDLALDKLHDVYCTKVYLWGLRLAYGHLILQLVEVVHGRLFGRHVPSVLQCLKWWETKTRQRLYIKFKSNHNLDVTINTFIMNINITDRLLQVLKCATDV